MKTLSVMLIAGLLAASTQARYSDGTGTAEDPYQIATAADLIALGESPGDYGKHFILTADIDLDPNLPGRKVFEGAVIAPGVHDPNTAEFAGTPFTGVFDGRGHSLWHLSVEGKDYVGLFGKVGSGAMVARLGLEAVDVNAARYYVGALAGCNEGCVLTSHSTGMVAGQGNIGGLVGINEGGIVASHSTATIGGSYSVGGLAGVNEGGIIASYSSGTVSGSRYIGGLVGYREGYIVASYSTGTVSGFDLVGGLVGVAYGPGSIAMCYSTGAVSAERHPGGLVGLQRKDAGAVASFWNIETSGQTASGAGTGLTTAQMQDIQTFLDAGWDFVDEAHYGTCDYWEIAPGQYPRLRFHAGAVPVMPEGAGTAEQPYVIRAARDLGTVWFEPRACYRLPNQVDLDGITWSVAAVPWFNGSFDGRDGGLRFLRVRGGGYLGLFGQLDGAATVTLLGLTATEVVGTGDYVGGLAGVSGGTITDCCSLDGVVKGGVGSYVGGLAGANHGSIVNGLSDGAVIGGEYGTGGLVGANSGRITASHASGSVDGNRDVGGLVGTGGGTITASYSTGAVRGRDHVGGLLGSGVSVDLISACYSISAVIGDTSVAGLLGYLDMDEKGAGGLPGEFYGGAVRDCYSISAVIGNDHVGGLGGQLRFEAGDMSRCYSVSAINGKSDAGPLAGAGDFDALSGCLWDIQVCGRTTGEGGTGKTTAEMQTAATFLALGWDFAGETANGTEDIWKIDEGKDYPHLSWELTED